MANVIKHKRGSGSDPGASDLVVGEVAIRTDVGKLFTKMDNGSVSEIAGGGSDIVINTLSSSSATGGGSATFNGSAYRFTLSQPPSVSAQQLLVSINGVIQKPVAGTGQPSEGFSVSGSDIILGDAPATGADFFILTFKSLGVSEPADNSVTSAKIADGAIVNADINASAAIAGSKIAPTFTSTITIGNTAPALVFTDSDHNPDYRILVNSGSFRIQDATNSYANRFLINSDGHIDIAGNLDVGAGLDVTGAITGTGDLTIDTNTLHVDSSNNRVGIGTTSPHANLHIQGGNSSSSPAEVNIWGGTLGRSKFNLVATETGTTTGTFQLTTESSVPSVPQLITVQNSGNVGIGITSIASSTRLALSESSGNAQTLEIIAANSTGAGSQPGIKFTNSSGGNTGGIFADTNSGEVRLQTGGTPRLIIASSGDLDTNSNHILLNDTAQLKMGASNDFIIRHNGTDNTLGGASTTKFYNPLLEIYKTDGTKKAAAFDPDGSQELYFNNDRVFYTETRGVRIGDITKIFENSSHNTAIMQHADIHHAIIFRGSSNAGGTTITNANVTTFREYGDFVFMTGPINMSTRLTIAQNGNIGAPSGTNIYNASDSRLKKNVVTLDKGLDAIKALRPVSFNWIDGFCDEEKDTLYGFVAQEAQTVDSNLVAPFGGDVNIGNDPENPDQTITDPLRVNEKYIIPMLVKAIQELTAKVEALEAG